LYTELGLAPVPAYTHLPLVIGADGRRLAKRHGDSRLVHYREQGVSAARVLGLLGEWCGCGPRQELSLAEFLERFQMTELSTEPIIFSPTDDAWLLAGSKN
ncbi:MAG: tRNA glutamyl-Q(34) synthetase GluQRS, partial [Bythopirellula sp.]